MATYVMIGKYSLEAMKGISTDRTDQAVALMARYGGTLRAAYAMLGQNDLLLVTDFADAQHAMQASVALARSTGIGFTTAPAVTVEEFDRLVEGIR
jgi:uncharacterized protein with GYD domain